MPLSLLQVLFPNYQHSTEGLILAPTLINHTKRNQVPFKYRDMPNLGWHSLTPIIHLNSHIPKPNNPTCLPVSHPKSITFNWTISDKHIFIMRNMKCATWIKNPIRSTQCCEILDVPAGLCCHQDHIFYLFFSYIRRWLDLLALPLTVSPEMALRIAIPASQPSMGFGHGPSSTSWALARSPSFVPFELSITLFFNFVFYFSTVLTSSRMICNLPYIITAMTFW